MTETATKSVREKYEECYQLAREVKDRNEMRIITQSIVALDQQEAVARAKPANDSAE